MGKYTYLKDLIQILVLKELKSKYTSITVGFFWVLALTITQMIVLSIVFSLFVKIPVENYPLFVFSGLLPWTFFSSSLFSGTLSLSNNRDLIKKISFSKELLVISSIFAQLIIFLLALILFLILAFFFTTQIPNLILLLLAVTLQTILSISLSFLLSTFEVYYKDVTHALQLVVLLWFYITPIIYPISLVPENILIFYSLNPMVGIITFYQSLFLNQSINMIPLLIAVTETLFLFFLGIFIFRKRSNYFADSL